MISFPFNNTTVLNISFAFQTITKGRVFSQSLVNSRILNACEAKKNEGRKETFVLLENKHIMALAFAFIMASNLANCSISH